LNSTLEPLVVSIIVATVKLIVNLQSHVGEERRLRTAEVLDLGISMCLLCLGKQNLRSYDFRSRSSSVINFD
jgi:hypothetical protein